MEKNIIDIGEKLDTQIEEKGIADKIKGFFSKKFSKNKDVQNPQ